MTIILAARSESSGQARRLQDILSSPKPRGQLGEWSLKNLLENILPHYSCRLQYPFKDGRVVGALVKTNNCAVSIDAKVPLPTFEWLVEADGDSKNLLEYTIEKKKVIPVSPNLISGCLMTAVMDLHGLQIEKQAAEICENL